MPGFIPSESALKSVITLAQRSPEAAQHFVASLEKTLTLNGLMPQFKQLFTAMQQFATAVEAECDARNQHGKIWAGALMDSPLVALQKAHPPAAELEAGVTLTPAPKQEVPLLITIEANGSWERFYGAGMEKTDAPGVLDRLMLLWLAEHNIVRRDHINYQLDKNGNEAPLAPSVFHDMVTDTTTGLSAYLEKNTHGQYVPVLTTEVHPSIQPAETQSSSGAGA